MKPIKMGYDPETGQATVRPLEYLSTEFSVYITCCRQAGFTYQANRKRNIGPLDAASELHAALRSHRFDVEISQDLAQELGVRATTIEQSLAQARAKADVLQQRIADGWQLDPFQIIGAGWLSGRRAGGLFDQMGLGKTPQALVATPTDAGVLVIAPKSAKPNWVKEASRWRPDLRSRILEGRNGFCWPRPGWLHVINYDILPPLAPGMTSTLACERPGHPVALIADEAHNTKNAKAARTVRFKALAQMVLDTGGHAWALTGTPLLNRPLELWTILDNIGCAEEAFGHFGRFLQMFNAQKGRFGIEWDKCVASPEVPKALRRVSLMRLRKDVLKDLPNKRHQTKEATIDEDTRRACDEIVQKLQTEDIDLGNALAVAEGTKEDQLLFTEYSRVRERLATAKIPAMLEIVEEHEENEVPLVVFSQHRAPIDMLGRREGWACIVGGMKSDAAQAVVDKFQAGKLKGLAGTIGAMGTAHTLHHSHNMLFVDMSWTPGLNTQAEDRCCRRGQKNGVLVTTLVADHVLDWRVIELTQNKQKLVDEAVNASAVTSDTDDRVDDIRSMLDNAKVGDTSHEVFVRRNGAGLRAAGDALERWAGAALATLSAYDPDGATDRNGVGFNSLDTGVGRSLAQQLAAKGGLSDKQWKFAVRICRKYHGQVGEAPE